MSLMQRLRLWSAPAHFSGLSQMFLRRFPIEHMLRKTPVISCSWFKQTRYKHNSVWTPLNLDHIPLAAVENRRNGLIQCDKRTNMDTPRSEQIPLYFPGNDLYERKWEIVEQFTEVARKDHVRFTFASYNVLAQNLLEDHSNLYSSNNEYLQWEYRKKNLCAELAYLSPDIICLQEVHRAHFEDTFSPALGALGYKAEFLKRTGDKEDGCATFYKADKFVIDQLEHVPYFVPDVPVLNRDNVGLILLLKPTGEDPHNARLCVANTHLLFNPRRGDIKLAQVQCLFAAIDKLAYKCTEWTRQRSKRTVYHPIIISGDFNAFPQSKLYTFVRSGWLRYKGLSKQGISGQVRHPSSNPALSIPILPQSLGVTEQCQYKSKLDERRAPKVTETHRVNTAEIEELRQNQLSKKRGSPEKRHDWKRKRNEGDGSRSSDEGNAHSQEGATAHEVVIPKEQLQKHNHQSEYPHHRHDPDNAPHMVVMSKNEVHPHGNSAHKMVISKDELDKGVTIGGDDRGVHEVVMRKDAPKRSELSAAIPHIASIEADLMHQTNYSFDTGIMSHKFPLISAYSHQRVTGPGQRAVPEVTTYHERANVTVDYIFYSKGTHKFKWCLSQLRKLNLYTTEDMKRIGSLPNKYISSDHTILMAEFEWYIGKLEEHAHRQSQWNKDD